METKARCKSFYQESRADKLQKVEVTRRSAIATYKIEDLYLMCIAAYLPTNTKSNEGFKTASMDVRQAIVGAKRKYKNFSYIMAGDLNIDQRHDEERRSIFKRFLRDVEGIHWVPKYPSYEYQHWKTRSHLDGAVISDNVVVMSI